MTTTPRESVVTALLALLATSAGIITTGRRLVQWDEIDPPLQPALFLVQERESFARVVQHSGGPPMKTLTLTAYVYAKQGGLTTNPGDPNLNSVLDAIEAVLFPTNGTKQNLGIPGVQRVEIAGPLEYDGGVLGNQAIAVIPLEVLYL